MYLNFYKLYSKMRPTRRYMKGQLFLKSGKGVYKLTANDVILRLVEMLLAEKDKNANQQKQEEQSNKD